MHGLWPGVDAHPLGQVRAAFGQVCTVLDHPHPPRHIGCCTCAEKRAGIGAEGRIGQGGEGREGRAFRIGSNASAASGHPAGSMGAVYSRRARSSVAEHVLTRSHNFLARSCRWRLSVADRWALLFRKARGLQFLCHLYAYSGHALKFLYKKHPPLRDWRHPPLE